MSQLLANLYSYGNNYSYGIAGATPGAGTTFLKKVTATSAVTLNRQEPSYQVKLSSYGKALSALDSFSAALKDIKNTRNIAPFSAASDEVGVLSAKASKDMAGPGGTYDIHVAQIAKAQTLTSGVFADKDSTIIGTGSIKLQVGSYDAEKNTFTPNGDGKTILISTSKGTLSGIAQAINQADTGVVAVVNKVNSGYQLALTSVATGSEHVIKLTTTPGDLTALAYDPTQASNSLTEKTAAQNAQLTVNNISVSSQSNTVTSAIAGITLELTGLGATTVKVTRDSAVFAASAQKFVDAYNTLKKGLTNELLPNDGLLAKVSRDISNTLNQAVYGVGNGKITLSDVGIVQQAGGTLALDKKKLQNTFAVNPDNAAKLLASAADKLSAIAVQDGGPSGELHVADRALNKAVADTTNYTALLQSYNIQYTFPRQLSGYLMNGDTRSQAGRYALISSLVV